MGCGKSQETSENKANEQQINAHTQHIANNDEQYSRTPLIICFLLLCLQCSKKKRNNQCPNRPSLSPTTPEKKKNKND